MRVSVCVLVEEDYRYHWLDDHSLEIRNVSRNDAGVYAIKCENDEGANEISITLDVQCKTLHTGNGRARVNL